MLHHLIWRTLHQHGAIMDDVSPIDNVERFADIMVSNQNANSMAFQMPNQITNLTKRDRVNAGKRFIE